MFVVFLFLGGNIKKQINSLKWQCDKIFWHFFPYDPTHLGHCKQQSWARVPGFAFPHSRVPGVLGTWAHGNEIIFKARGNAECEEVGTLISRA